MSARTTSLINSIIFSRRRRMGGTALMEFPRNDNKTTKNGRSKAVKVCHETDMNEDDNSSEVFSYIIS